MSFDFNPIGNLSNVQASAKSQDGGGGNTGYFRRGKKEEETESTFTRDYPEDSFEQSGTLDEIQNQSFLEIIKSLIQDFIEAIKGFFAK